LIDAASHLVHVLGFKPAKGTISFRQLFRPYASWLFLGFIFLLATNAMTLMVPRIINIGVQVIEGKPATMTIESVLIWLFCLAILGALVRTLSRRTLFNVGRGIERDLRSLLFYHLSLLSSNFYEKHSVGNLMSHLTNDINNVRMFAGFAVLNLLNLVIVFSGSVPILIGINAAVAFACLLPFLLVIVSAQMLTGRMFHRAKEYQASIAKLTEHVQENLSGAAVVRVFHQERFEEKKFEKTNQDTYLAAKRVAKITSVMFPLTRMMGGLGIAVAFFVGGREVVLGRMSVGDYVEVNARLLQLSWPAISMGFILSVYSQSCASLSRINDLFEQPPLIIDGSHSDAPISMIETKNLSVRLEQHDRLALKNINVQLKRGRVVGVVGRSGSGKSTLVRILAREILCHQGQIFYNKVEGMQWKLEPLHRQIAVVSSEPFLFSASVRENITFAKIDASDTEIASVAEQVGLTEDIAGLPEGLDTMIGERGVMLSGGQRQRVALARALLVNAPVLLLDDCLSAVDSVTESKIVKTLRKKRDDICLLIVSHRLSAIRHADEIVVLEKGQIVQRGRHEELLGQEQLYGALWGIEQLQKGIKL
jgi:ATP-binding cassette, subfamily B, multidrug efflux pump